MKKKVNENYTPLVISILILLVLVAILTFTLTYKMEGNGVTTVTSKLDTVQDEIVVDISNVVCDSINDISTDASKVTFDYALEDMVVDRGYSEPFYNAETGEVEDGEEEDIYGKGFRFTISNITENLLISISNNYDDETTIIKYSDTENGIYEYTTVNSEVIVKYDIKIYSANTECDNILVREFEVTVPKYNHYSDYQVCENVESSYCNELTYEEFDINEFSNNTVQEGQKNLTEKIENENKEASKKELRNKIIIGVLIALIFIVLGVVITIVLRNRKKIGE